MFGEIGFFSGKPRSVTVKSRGFSELMYLDKFKFLKCILEKHKQASEKFSDIYGKLLTQPRDFSPLHIKCYYCSSKGHIAIDCEFFHCIQGNLQIEGIKTD